MAEIQEQELVTKGLLQAFGTKCKRMFKLNPVHAQNSSSTRWIKISTSLLYNDSVQGFDDLYINVQGVTTESTNDTKKVINSNFYVRTNHNKVIYFAQGVNLGTETIQAMVLVKESDNKTGIYLQLPADRYPRDIIVDVIACMEENLLFSVVEDIDFEASLSEPTTYEQISTSVSTLPFSRAAIGSIIVQLQEATQFTIIEDQSTSNGVTTVTSSKSYPEYSTFAKIFEATQADKLSHGLTFQYDWENPIKSTDSAVAITNGTFTQGAVVKIPIPDLLRGGASTEEGTWATRVQVENGIVTAVDSTSGINLATTSAIGGIRLMDDSTSSIGDKVPVQLDSYGQAFIDKAYFDQDKHRDDLNKPDYQGDNINKFINNIWQHTGTTTGGFVNGYFYKCTKTAFTVSYDTSNSPYSVGTQIGTKLENYVYDNGLTLDITKPFRLYVDAYPTQKSVISGDTTTNVNVKISELDEFKLVNLNSQSAPVGTPLVMTKAQLSEILDITIKTTDGWYTALTKDYPQSVMTLPFTLNSTSYAWKQWDVQPRTGIGSALEFITNDEIDYLFDVHVNSLSINDDKLDLSVGDTYTLEVTVSPADADNQMVTWSSSDPSAVSVVKTSPTEAEVTVGSDAVVGENYIITCTSVDSERTITCTITIVS